MDNFVQELLTVTGVKPHKQLEKQEKLLQWVKVTLVTSVCRNAKDYPAVWYSMNIPDPYYSTNIARIPVSVTGEKGCIKPSHFVYWTSSPLSNDFQKEWSKMAKRGTVSYFL